MDKKKSMPAWVVLTVIALVAAVCLGATYDLTKDTIRERAEQDAIATRAALVTDASDFEQVADVQQVDSIYTGKDASGNVVGYVAQTTVTGFGGPIEITVGTDTKGILTGIRVGGSSFSETAGLGARAKEAAFTDQFAGVTAPVELGKDVDAITSATITSSAVVRGVNSAVEAIAKVAGFSVSDGSSAGSLGDGRYTATVRGFGGPVYVEITLDDQGVITAIKIGNDEFNESAGYGKKALEPEFYEQFIGKSGQLTLGVDIDAISGATVTSTAVVNAVNKAMLYYTDPEAAAAADQAEEFVLPEIPADAVTSTASKKGYGGPVEATVTFDKDVTKILMVTFGGENFAETDGVGSQIQEDFFWHQFIGKSVPLQDGDIDLITGATYSSTAAVEAVEKAYRKLVPDDAATTAPTDAPASASAPLSITAGTSIASSKGFGGPVEVTVTVDDNGTITALKIGGDNFAETDGVGSQVLDESFAQQFIGKTYPIAESDIDMISGATVSSTAVIKAINKAIEKLGGGV